MKSQSYDPLPMQHVSIRHCLSLLDTWHDHMRNKDQHQLFILYLLLIIQNPPSSPALAPVFPWVIKLKVLLLTQISLHVPFPPHQLAPPPHFFPQPRFLWCQLVLFAPEDQELDLGWQNHLLAPLELSPPSFWLKLTFLEQLLISDNAFFFNNLFYLFNSFSFL